MTSGIDFKKNQQTIKSLLCSKDTLRWGHNQCLPVLFSVDENSVTCFHNGWAQITLRS